MDLTKLKKEFRQYADKRTLASSYDLFLCDKSIISDMPQVLGKVFYSQRHKQPLPVKICQSKPADDIKAVLKSTTLTIPSGPCVGVRIGRCSMTAEQLSKNCNTVFRSAAAIFRDQGLTVKSAHITATDCVAVPVYEQELTEGSVVIQKAPTKTKKRKAESSSQKKEQEEGSDTSSDVEEKEAKEKKDASKKKNASAEKTQKTMPLLKKRKVMKKSTSAA